MSALSTGGGIVSNVISPSPWGAMAVPGIMMSGKSGGSNYTPKYQIGANGQYQWSTNQGQPWTNVPQGWATADPVAPLRTAISQSGMSGNQGSFNVMASHPYASGPAILQRSNPNAGSTGFAGMMGQNIRGFQNFLNSNPGGTYAPSIAGKPPAFANATVAANSARLSSLLGNGASNSVLPTYTNPTTTYSPNPILAQQIANAPR